MQEDCGRLSLEVPDSWTARTMFILIEPAREGEKPVTIVVANEPWRPGETLQAHSWRKAFEISRRMSNFELVESRADEIGGREAMRMRIRWSDERDSLEQVIVYVDGREQGVLSFACNLSGAPDARWQAALESVLASVRFPAPSAPTLQASTRAPRPPPPEPSPPMIPMPGDRASRAQRKPCPD